MFKKTPKPKFKIEYSYSYTGYCYILYKNWDDLYFVVSSFKTLEDAEAQIEIMRDYPKYYE